jgi:hypothetical protein
MPNDAPLAMNAARRRLIDIALKRKQSKPVVNSSMEIKRPIVNGPTRIPNLEPLPYTGGPVRLDPQPFRPGSPVQLQPLPFNPREPITRPPVGSLGLGAPAIPNYRNAWKKYKGFTSFQKLIDAANRRVNQ